MSWICPHCGTTATLQTVDVDTGARSFIIKTAADEEGMVLWWFAVKCPSKTCGKFVLDVTANFGAADVYESGSRKGTVTADQKRPVGTGRFRFEPRVGSPLSAHVPKAVAEDYNEACLIKDLSPKAAATLCRRSLQGMVRDFWGVAKASLALELESIKPQCDAGLFEAMSGLRSIGNIGAHPERDINLVIEVEEGEVESLLELLRILDKEWYVDRASRAERLSKVVSLGALKSAQKRPQSGQASPEASIPGAGA